MCVGIQNYLYMVEKINDLKNHRLHVAGDFICTNIHREIAGGGYIGKPMAGLRSVRWRIGDFSREQDKETPGFAFGIDGCRCLFQATSLGGGGKGRLSLSSRLLSPYLNYTDLQSRFN